MNNAERAELRALCEKLDKWAGIEAREFIDGPVDPAITLYGGASAAIARLLDALERSEQKRETLRREVVLLRSTRPIRARKTVGYWRAIAEQAERKATEWMERCEKAANGVLGCAECQERRERERRAALSTTDTLRRAGVHLATKPLARPDRQRVSPVQEPSVVERIRRWLSSVPIRITKHGVSRLDFEARGRGERR